MSNITTGDNYYMCSSNLHGGFLGPISKQQFWEYELEAKEVIHLHVLNYQTQRESVIINVRSDNFKDVVKGKLTIFLDHLKRMLK